MENSILSKETLLDNIEYTPESFLKDILTDAVSFNIITEDESKNYLQSLFRVLFEYAVEVCISLDRFNNIDEARKIIINNHMYIVSSYLSRNYKPSEALLKITDIPASKLHDEAVVDFNLKLNNISNKLIIFSSIVMNNSFFAGAYKKIIKFVSDFKRYDTLFIDFEAFELPKIYITLDFFTIKTNDIIDGINSYINSFLKEFGIMQKFGSEVLNKLRKINTERIEKEEENNFSYIQEKRKQRIEEVKKSLTEEWKKNRKKVTKEYRQKVMEEEMKKFDNEISKKTIVIDPLQNNIDNLINHTLIEYFISVYCIIYPESALPVNYFDKIKILTENKEVLFNFAFENNYIVEFSKVEQEYIKKYLF